MIGTRTATPSLNAGKRVLDEGHDQKDKKKPGKNQTIPKKPMKGPGVSKDSVKPTPMKSKPAKKATT